MKSRRIFRAKQGKGFAGYNVLPVKTFLLRGKEKEFILKVGH